MPKIVTWLVATALLATPLPAAAQVLTQIPGSPFEFRIAINSNVVRLGPGGRTLFVVNQGSVSPMSDDGAVTSLAVADDGSLTWIDTERAGMHPCAVALNRAGDRLYVTSWTGIHVYEVSAAGALTPLQTVTGPSSPDSYRYNGLEYVPLPGGDFVYVNENTRPVNHVTAYAVVAGGGLVEAGTFATGDVGSESGLFSPPRLLVGTGGRLYAGNAASVTVFDVLPDGALAMAPGSPFPLPFADQPPHLPGEPPRLFAPALAADPGGRWLFAGLGHGVAQLSVAPDGALSIVGTYTADDATFPITGLAVHPSATYVLAAHGTDGIRTWQVGSFGPPLSTGNLGAGIAFNSAGTLLFAGQANGQAVRVLVYRFGPADVPRAACVGSAAARRVVPADAARCLVTVDAANGLAGGCFEAASCTFAGMPSLPLGLGPADVVVTATSASGATASCTSYLDVVDVSAPTVSIAPSPAVLWPPDHRLVPVDPGAGASDACDPAPSVSCGATSSEPENGPGDGDAAPDVSSAGGALLLRAERSGRGAGRTYSVVCTAEDDSGNVATAAAAVVVPHDRRR